MLRLGHIPYANTFPVHGGLVDRGPGPDVALVPGTPGELNRLLASGAVDVAPCSSVEYARHAPRYRILPGFTIASIGRARSILLELVRPPGRLGPGDRVALPTASATSAVLARILLEHLWGVRPSYFCFRQEEEDPFGEEATAGALWIGDPALDRREASRGELLDLGRIWTRWTGLPFVYALWQTPLGAERDGELAGLWRRLRDSRRDFLERAPELARAYAPHFRRDPGWLLRYWGELRYELDGPAVRGLLRFYALAREIGEVPRVPELRYVPVDEG